MCAGRTNEGERCSVRPDRDPTAEARSPPARSACFSHPVQMSQRGVRAAAVKAYLVIYKDKVAIKQGDKQAMGQTNDRHRNRGRQRNAR